MIIICYLYQRDVIEHLMSTFTTKLTDFAWFSQAKYYYKPPNKDGTTVDEQMSSLKINLLGINSNYGYEYKTYITLGVDTAYIKMF